MSLVFVTRDYVSIELGGKSYVVFLFAEFKEFCRHKHNSDFFREVTAKTA